ncbi:hypothetical protein F511_23691 [Dorcoceras hygrometricum]|uniref:SMP-LTD domain-containing protein n=1 Tax=Dorcoceras hygrometricum TaxID=472368 RepID=A0A2Z7BH62_9LAMI|nr:hypothetical protein F511_23691 [Dorcoceras hygrometricum]
MLLLLLAVFVLGAVAAVALEALAVWIFVRWLTKKVEREEIRSGDAESALYDDLSSSLHEKQGALWVLEPEKVPKSWSDGKLPPEQRRRKDILEVSPVKKYARIKDRCLILTESDGSQAKILLKGCNIAAVSATSLSSKKWAKRYPIKLESKDSVAYKGYNIVYLYLETSWEKESWCKALRLASCDDDDRNRWFSTLNVEFQKYLASLNVEYPSVLRPSAGVSAELLDKSVKADNSSSKVRQFLRKLGKKASRKEQEYKLGATSVSGQEEKKFSEKSRSFQDSILSYGSGKVSLIEKPLSASFDDAYLPSSISTSTDSGSRNHLFGISDADFDEGTMCLNLLISRLFFDVKNNPRISDSMKQRIQNSVSNMRMPSYIGEVTCTAADPGSLPPRILAMRVLPLNMNEMWAMEIDVDYLGGTVLSFETRLEVRELELEGEKMQLETNAVGDVTSGILADFVSIEEQLKNSGEVMDETNQKDESKPGPGENDNSKSTQNVSSQTSRWKSMLHSLTRQVSQVPISLRIKISSLRGTMRLYVKPPPSDQIWFGFTSMPDIGLHLESSVGDRKITSGHLALLLISRFKVAIRETLVLPNRVSLGIPWMLAEKDDWVPRNVAPFMWYRNNQDSVNNSTKREVPSFQSGEATHNVEASHGIPPRSETKLEKSKTIGRVPTITSKSVEASQGIPPRSETNLEKSKTIGRVPTITTKSVEPLAASSSSTPDSTAKDSSYEELTAPLIKNDRLQGFAPRSIETKLDPHTSQSLEFLEGQHIQNTEEDDTRTKRIGTKERMLGLGKKMGEKLEVKRRNIEEKGRSFVERMRAP